MDNNELKMEIEKIKERNKKVELDKAWETSFVRRLCICILTYIVVVVYSIITKKCYKYMDQFFGTSNRFYFINFIFKSSKKNVGKRKKIKLITIESF